MANLFALHISNKQYKGIKSLEDFFVTIADNVPEAFAKLQKRMTAGVFEEWVRDDTFVVQLMRYSNPHTIITEGISWNSYLPDYTLYQEYDMIIQNKVITDLKLRVDEEERYAVKRAADDDTMDDGGGSRKRARSY